MADMASYIFGGTSGTPSYEELVRRRQIATANAMRQRKSPTTFGEGLTALGEGIGDRLESNRLTEAERAFAGSEDARLAAARAGAAGGAVPGRTVAPAAGGATRVPTERIAPDAAPAGPLPGSRADAGRNQLAALLDPDLMSNAPLANAPQEVASLDPTLGAATPPGSRSDEVEGWKRSIGGIESSNDYGAIGVPTKYGRAMGRYGVMEANVPKWTAEALGQSLTPQQFLVNEKAQDDVFKHKFGQYVARYGPEKAARAWYGGEGNINNLNATDAHEKLSVHDYGRDFMNRLRGRRSDAEEDTSTAPVQLAALGGPSGTMTDAPPVGAGIVPNQPIQPPQPPIAPWPADPAPAPNWTPKPNEPITPRSDVENPDQPTVTEDIRPMSVAPNQFAQVGPEMFSPRRMSDTPVAMGPNPVPLPAAPGAPARPPAAPADLPPSLTPVPPASKQVMADPGAAPRPPERVDELPGQRQWMDVIHNRNTSPYAKEYAQNEFNRLEKRRTEINALREADYHDQRELWQQKKAAYDKHVMTADERDIDQLNKRLAAEKAQRDLVVLGPLEEKIKAAEGKLKQAEVDAIPDAIAKRKAELDKAHVDYSIAIRTLHKPETHAVGGTVFGQPYDPSVPPGTPQPGKFTVLPGLPQPKDPLTEKQASTIKFLQRATVASSQIGDSRVLAGLTDSITSKIPVGGNYMQTPEFQRAHGAAFTWLLSVLRDESGALIGPQEAAQKYSTYFPIPGDSDQVIRDKTFRRKNDEESLYHSLGDAKSQVDKWREERKGRKVETDPKTGTPYEEGTTRVNNKTGVKQRVMGGHWENEEDLR